MLLLYKESYHLIGALMKVHRDIGPGLPEFVYQKACEAEFFHCGIKYQTQPRRWIVHRNRNIVELIPDFLIAGQIILDLKAIFGNFPQSALSQVFCYAKLFNVPLAFLANFGLQSLAWKRLVCDFHTMNLEIDSSLRNHSLSPHRKAIYQVSVEAIRTVWRCQGPGYTEPIYRKLIEAELAYRSIEYKPQASITASAHNLKFSKVSIPVVVVENQCPLYIIALHKSPTASHLARMRTYLTHLNHPHGYIVNFGPNEAQIISVTAKT